jgi:diacylglycerol kinase family enzyme
MPAALVFLNERSGTARARADIEQAFRDAEVECQVRILNRYINLPAIIDYAASCGTAIVAAGGDGTVNCVAAAIVAKHPDAVFGVLPVGTLNHFAKDMKLPLTLEGAAKVIGAGVTTAVDAGEVNGRIFVNNSSIGFYPGMVLQRERLKKVGWNKWVSLLVASFRQFLRFRHLKVRVTLANGEKLMRTTPFVFVGNNEYTMEGVEAGTRERLNSGRLYVYMAPGATRLSLLRLTLAALRHKVRESPYFEAHCVESFTVEHGRRRGHVALAGEVVRLSSPLHYRTRPGVLQVLVP